MIFTDFLNYIPKIAKENLIGEEAHEKLSPPERINFVKEHDLKSLKPRKAAVLMLFYPKNTEPHLILILRNAYPGVHSSQVGFPGGKVESFDLNLEATALRETHEEIGIAPEKIEIVRAFSELYIPPSNFMVYPFLGFSTEELVFKPDPREVFGIIELSLNSFLDDINFTTKVMETSYMKEIELPVFKFGDTIVWGATAMMLNELRMILNNVME